MVTGAETDCLDPHPGRRILLHGDGRTILDFDVMADEVVCLAPSEETAAAGRRLEVSWHARSGGQDGASAAVVASNR